MRQLECNRIKIPRHSGNGTHIPARAHRNTHSLCLPLSLSPSLPPSLSLSLSLALSLSLSLSPESRCLVCSVRSCQERYTERATASLLHSYSHRKTDPVTTSTTTSTTDRCNVGASGASGELMGIYGFGFGLGHQCSLRLRRYPPHPNSHPGRCDL